MLGNIVWTIVNIAIWAITKSFTATVGPAYDVIMLAVHVTGIGTIVTDDGAVGEGANVGALGAGLLVEFQRQNSRLSS